MTLQQVIIFGQSKQKRKSFLIKALILAVSATVWTDYIFSSTQSTSFYLSESLLFSATYWLLFLPMLNILWKLSSRKPVPVLLYTGLITGGHLLCYPALVGLISLGFYDHAFPYRQTFDYGLTTYSIKTFIIYGLSIPLITLLRGTPPAASGKPGPVNSLLVPDINNTKTLLQISEILYLSANSPYVNVYHPVKKYLLTETLRSLEKQLPPDRFVRIHKSCIVNVEKVVSCRSRLNGDYDLELCEGTTLRLSRNYTANFRTRFHRDTPD